MLNRKKLLYSFKAKYMNDLKYLFAYTVPLATLVSVLSNGVLTFTAPIYTFIFIPVLEIILADYDKIIDRCAKRKSTK